MPGSAIGRERGLLKGLLRLAGRIRLRPAQMLLLGFAALIAAGACLLMLPAAACDAPVSWIDAFFTATSAACVTGLTVVDTGSAFTFFGQAVILGLIQVGGLGIMTFSTLLVLMAGRRPSLGDSQAVMETLGRFPSVPTVRGVIRNVLVAVALIEGAGALVLTVCFLFERQGLHAVWSGVFHSVSAFCNAGFGLHPDNLVRYRGNIAVCFTVMGLIVAGGIGFVVLADLSRFLRREGRPHQRRIEFHSKLVLWTSGLLIIAGAVAVYFLERGNEQREMPAWMAAMNALFQSVTPRTAGFNTVDIGGLTEPTLFLLMLLMFIGASPCSTGGGVKTSTFAIIWLVAISRFQARDEPVVFGRTVPRETVGRAVAVVLASCAVLAVMVSLLVLAEGGGVSHRASRGLFLETCFEAVSAFGTVGLSVGIAPSLSVAGKLVVIALMFIGRVGPLSVVLALAMRGSKDRIGFPTGDALIG